MRKSLSLLSLFALFVLPSCQKDDIVEAVTGERPACGSAGARVSATINGSAWCGDALVHAVMEDSSLMVSAVNLNGSTLTFNMDQVGMGTMTIEGDHNGVLYLETGVTYLVDTNSTGQLHITSYTAATGRVSGSLDVLLHSMVGDLDRVVHIDFDVTAAGGPE